MTIIGLNPCQVQHCVLNKLFYLILITILWVGWIILQIRIQSLRVLFLCPIADSSRDWGRIQIKSPPFSCSSLVNPRKCWYQQNDQEICLKHQINRNRKEWKMESLSWTQRQPLLCIRVKVFFSFSLPPTLSFSLSISFNSKKQSHK